MEERLGRRSWEPCDFFELAHARAPVEAIAPGCHCLLYGLLIAGR
jgi:hypothetical protein